MKKTENAEDKKYHDLENDFKQRRFLIEFTKKGAEAIKTVLEETKASFYHLEHAEDVKLANAERLQKKAKKDMDKIQKELDHLQGKPSK